MHSTVTLMFDIAPSGLLRVAHVLVAGLGGRAQIAVAASAFAATASALGEAGALLLGDRSDGLHMRDGCTSWPAQISLICATVCREGAVWHRRAQTTLEVHVQLSSRAVAQNALGRAHLSMCLRCVCVCVHYGPRAEVDLTREASFRWSFFEPHHRYKCCCDKQAPSGPSWAGREDAARSVLNDCDLCGSVPVL